MPQSGKGKSNCYDDDWTVVPPEEPASSEQQQQQQPQQQQQQQHQPESRYVALKKFVAKGAVFDEPLPPAPSKAAGYRYYVPGSHIVQSPTVWCGSVLAGELCGWNQPPNPTGFYDLEHAVNAAASLFSVAESNDTSTTTTTTTTTTTSPLGTQKKTPLQIPEGTEWSNSD